MKQINIDIETFSSVDLSKAGVYRYADSSDFEILLFGYAVDMGEVQVIDLASGEKIPEEIICGLSNPDVLKYAYNAQFERVCLGKYLGHTLDPASWRCTMVASLYLGLPAGLAAVGAVLGLEKQKLSEGKDLIKYFSVPCKPTKTNGGRTRNLPSDAPEKWQIFKIYNHRDVETEMEILTKVSRFPVPDFLWKQYATDQRINDRGIEIDRRLAEQAIRCDEEMRERNLARAQELTGLENPNSPIQLKDWLAGQGVTVSSLSKKEVAQLLKSSTGKVKEVLELRQLLAKSSVRKYDAMRTCTCSDGRAHGLLQFYGANRTGRWAGRLVQVQNLPQNHLPDLENARNLVKSGEFELLDMLYDSVPNVLSELIRTAFIPKKGCKFIVADYSAVEARALSWMAGEKWRMEVFEKNGDIYSETAGRMFHCHVEKNGENGHLRQRGKVAELALGYGGSSGAMVAMGAKDMGLSDSEIKDIVDNWRAVNPKIVSLWWEIDKAVLKAVREKKVTKVKCFTFRYESGFLIATLPSGRSLFYVRPRLEPNEYGRDSLTYEGVGEQKHWMRIESYGPKITENLTQAFCRDLLAEAMERLTAAGYQIVMHIHDEVVLEAPKDADLSDACRIMSETPTWEPGLKLNAAGYECMFYQKD
jgi:DNA polymerase